MIRLFGILALWGILTWPALAATPDDLPLGGTAEVSSVIDGDTVILNDGREIRLVGLQAPKLALGRAGFTPWPLAEDAKAHLAQLILGQTVTLRLAPQALDRHGRVLAHVMRVADGRWVQGEMLRAGLARVYTFADNPVLAAEMLALERQARADGSGLWGLPFYAVRSPENVVHDIGTFQIVEGRVLDVARIKGRVYVNFGTNWRTDFTLKIMARDEKAFIRNAVDLMALKGARVRVRGWLKSENGPMIELDHPERLELLRP